MSKKKKIIFLVGMVALIAVAAVCNILISNKIKNKGDANQTMSTTDFFAYYRLERENIRTENSVMLNAVISDPNADQASKKQATDALVAITDSTELELLLESLIKAQGISDVCVSTNAASQYINVIIADKITEEISNTIYGTICGQLNKDEGFVNILSIN